MLMFPREPAGYEGMAGSEATGKSSEFLEECRSTFQAQTIVNYATYVGHPTPAGLRCKVHKAVVVAGAVVPQGFEDCELLVAISLPDDASGNLLSEQPVSPSRGDRHRELARILQRDLEAKCLRDNARRKTWPRIPPVSERIEQLAHPPAFSLRVPHLRSAIRGSRVWIHHLPQKSHK